MVTGNVTGAASISERPARAMSFLPAGDFVVADLEYTTWPGAMVRGWSDPGEFREIVQIGAVRVAHGDSLCETDALSFLVRPTLNPVLSDYFMALTGITSDDVAEHGTTLESALQDFVAFTDGLPVLTHGGDDRVIVAECARKSLTNPMDETTWQDIRPPFEAYTGRKMMSSDLPAHFGLPDQGRSHDALADSRALLRVLAHLQEAGKLAS